MHIAKETWHERFYLYRQTDLTGVSGTGVVAEGVRFTDGTVSIHWCVPNMPTGTTTYLSIVDAMKVHGHNGSTMVMWLDTTEEAGGGTGDPQETGDADTNAGSPALA